MNSEEKARSVVHVVAGAVTDAAGRILIAQRPPGNHLAGSWEFPGGKLEPGEARVVGLARELREELGVSIREPRPLIRVRHAYTFGQVLIDMWVVSRYDGEPQGLDGQALRWCSQDELAEVDLLPADRPIVRALRLPERLRKASTPYYVVQEPGSARRYGRLPGLMSSSAEEGVAGADGASDTCNTRLRGVSCASVAAAVAAAGAGADFLALSETLVAGELAALCQSVAVPVYARGLALEEAWALGASGVAMIGTESGAPRR